MSNKSPPPRRLQLMRKNSSGGWPLGEEKDKAEEVGGAGERVWSPEIKRTDRQKIGRAISK